MFNALILDSLASLPLLGWGLLGLIVLTLQIFWRNSKASVLFSLVGLLGLILYSVRSFDPAMNQTLFQGMVIMDSYTQFFNLLTLGIVTVVILMVIPGLQESSKLFVTSYDQLPEFLICLIFSGFGVSVMASSNDLCALFLGLEILSISLYCLCGFYRTEIQSTESAFKYLMIGAFSTVLFLYGIAFAYGVAGSTSYDEITIAMNAHATSPLTLLSVIFLLAGFAFKLALVPFHLYTPDVYEGAPTPVTAYLSTIVKVGAIAAASRVLWGFLEPVLHLWQPFWLALCVLSILIGNLVALQQRTIKRLLAFSSISHAGFMGLALFTAGGMEGDSFPLLAYLVVYSAMTAGVFAILTYIENRDRVFMVEDLRGLSQKRFMLSLLMALFMLGLAGIPPFAGFMIKFWVLQSLIQQGFVGLAITAIVGSVLGVAYYLKVLMHMFMSETTGAAAGWRGAKDDLLSLRVILILATIITLIGGLRPQIFADWILWSLASR